MRQFSVPFVKCKANQKTSKYNIKDNAERERIIELNKKNGLGHLLK